MHIPNKYQGFFTAAFLIVDYNHLGLFIQIGVKSMIKRQKFEAFLNDATAI